MESTTWADRLRRGDWSAIAEAFDAERSRLERLVQFRMDRRLAARIDPEDVLQESYLNAVQRIQHYLQDPSRSFFIWLRLIVSQTLIDVHRRQFEAEKRDPRREAAFRDAFGPLSTSASLAVELAGDYTSPSEAADRNERMQRLEQALATMNDVDREIIALRHFEDLSNLEVAEVLGLSPTAASNRYVRALGRLKEILEELSQQSP